MNAPTYSACGIVLRKTKLGESDLIITLLASDGSQMRVVAKGARKPKGRFSSHLELYNIVDMLCVKGKSLDIVKECRISFISERLHTDPSFSSAASCIAELAERVTQPNLKNERLYGLSEKALRIMPELPTSHVPLLIVAFMLKTFALSGFRPSLDRCIHCNKSIAGGKIDNNGQMIGFSYIEGGIVCNDCKPFSEVIPIPNVLIGWLHALTMCKLEDIKQMDSEERTSFELLSICQQWCTVHIGRPLKSLNFFMTAIL